MKIHWKQLFYHWQQIDWLLLFFVAVLATWGGLTIRSTELYEGSFIYSTQHWILAAISLGISLAIARWRYDNFLEWHWLVYGLTNLSLIAVMVAGVSAKGAQRWISVAGFNLQPSEFAKLGLIITLAALLHVRPADNFRAIFQAVAVAAVPWALVFLQPDLGTSLVFGAVTLTMLYWANAKLGWIILAISPLVSLILYHLYLPGWLAWIGLMGLVGLQSLPPWRIFGAVGAIAVNFFSGGLGGILWGLLKDYQKNRLILFLDPEKDPLGGGYHLIQSRIAIGSGEVWGEGFAKGSQTQLNFVPEQHTDFVFSAVGEELGFVGAMLLVGVFFLVLMRLLAVALSAKDNFGSLLAIGVLGMIAFQVFVNIGMTIGLAPVTGIPLPWMSYGRSAMLMNFLAIGLVESVANHRQRSLF